MTLRAGRRLGRRVWRQAGLRADVIRLEPGTTKYDGGRMFPYASLPRFAEMMCSQREHASALKRWQGRLIPWVLHRKGRPVRASMRHGLARVREQAFRASSCTICAARGCATSSALACRVPWR